MIARVATLKCLQMGCLLGIFCLNTGLVSPVMAKAEGRSPEKADVRILIDVSGSMKENDPRNLRRSALRLLVGILPADTRAGVWTFGQYVNMEIPLGTVDKAWKRRAKEGAGRIHSRGLFTNIEEALKRSSEDWSGPTSAFRRHLILLTDGMVDVSKDPSKNRVSRQRIIDQMIPRLKAVNAELNTIALSKRADQDLMRQLAEETGGWYDQVDSAERLQRVFLRIFERVGKPDTLPLKDNRFIVDESVRELTLLVFQSERAQPTRIQTPGGEVFDAETAPESVSWHRDQGYDLLTVTGPEPGAWLVQAEEDPDNRVMVVTDLRMHVTDLPNRVVLGKRIPITASFTDQGRPVDRKEFLEVLRVTSEQRSAGTTTEPHPLLDDGYEPDQTASDGKFTQLIGSSFSPGVTEFVVTTRGKTFVRERRQTLKIVAPVILNLKTMPDDPRAEVSLAPVDGAIDPTSMEPTAELTGPNGQSQILPLELGEDDIWRTSLDLSDMEGNFSLSVTLTGSTPEGQELDIRLDPMILEGQAQSTAQLTEPPTEAPEAPSQSTPDLEDAPESDWVYDAILFLTGNLLLALIGGGIFWFVRRRQGSHEIRLLEDGEAAI